MLVYEQARQDAESVLSAHWNGVTPIDVESIAASLGLTVIYRPLMAHMSGLITKEKNERGATVMINSAHSPARQRFTLAHEVGHFYERTKHAHDQDFSFRDTRSTDRYDLREFYADEFAGSLLMPAQEIAQLGFQSGYAPALAKTFDVSTDAANRRLQRLKKHAAA